MLGASARIDEIRVMRNNISRRVSEPRADAPLALYGAVFRSIHVHMYRHVAADEKRARDSRPPLKATRLLAQLRERLRYLHYSYRTEQSYVYWTRFFVQFHGLRHPRELGRVEVEAFLTMLAAERKVSVSTHRQALSALLFLYKRCSARNCHGCRRSGAPFPGGACQRCSPRWSASGCSQ